MKYSLGISNFLEEISSLSHSIVFLYFFALIAEEGFYWYLFPSLRECMSHRGEGRRLTNSVIKLEFFWWGAAVLILHCCVWAFVSCSKWSGEGHGNPLQYSCLENPVDRGAWWAAVHGVA